MQEVELRIFQAKIFITPREILAVPKLFNQSVIAPELLKTPNHAPCRWPAHYSYLGKQSANSLRGAGYLILQRVFPFAGGMAFCCSWLFCEVVAGHPVPHPGARYQSREQKYGTVKTTKLLQ